MPGPWTFYLKRTDYGANNKEYFFLKDTGTDETIVVGEPPITTSTQSVLFGSTFSKSDLTGSPVRRVIIRTR
jgi:hypothetical protein